MRKNMLLLTISFLLAITSAGCAYRYYLGLHGPSKNTFPDTHTEDITRDAQCLDCHAPENASGATPVTSHPSFAGCLKCHNDPV